MQSKMHSGKSTQPNGNINTENHGGILVLVSTNKIQKEK